MDTLSWIRSFRVGGFAIFDLSLAFGAMWLAAPLLSKMTRWLGLEVPRTSWLLFTLPVSIAIHVLIGSWTPMTKNFFDPTDQVLLKTIVIVSFLLGLAGISLVKK